jgi:raffinose/stachyose/melibiose transport system permease protein
MMALDIYNSFYGTTGYEGVGQAKAVVFFLLVGAIVLVQLRLSRNKEMET